MSGKLTISHIEIFRSPIRLREPFIISLGEMHYAENVFLKITVAEGFTGFGECSPFASINGETIDTCFVVGQKLARNLLGKNPLDTEMCSDLMDRTIQGNASIKSAFSIAIFDIASQHAGMPLFAFLGGTKSRQIVTDYTISIATPQKMADAAVKTVGKGFEIIKVKLGKSGKKDIERITSIRKAIGMDTTVRIDANQGWSKQEAIDTLNALAGFNIQFCEEPVPKWDFMELPEISRKSRVPIMADESCFDHHDAKRLIDINACDYFNLKLGKSAGFTKALKIVKLAEDAGMKLQTGGFLESRLGFTASAHLALSSDCIEFFDLDSPLMMEEDPVAGGIRYGPGGLISVPEEPGLGASVDENYLHGLTMVLID